jgi:hypothetical protein
MKNLMEKPGKTGNCSKKRKGLKLKLNEAEKNRDTVAFKIAFIPV